MTRTLKHPAKFFMKDLLNFFIGDLFHILTIGWPAALRDAAPSCTATTCICKALEYKQTPEQTYRPTMDLKGLP